MGNRIPLTDQATLEDLVAVANQLRELAELADESDQNFAKASQINRVAGYLEREIDRREIRSMRTRVPDYHAESPALVSGVGQNKGEGKP